MKAHEEAAKECVHLKPKVRRRKSWESKAICDKREKFKEIVNLKEETPLTLNKQKFLIGPQRPLLIRKESAQMIKQLHQINEKTEDHGITTPNYQ